MKEIKRCKDSYGEYIIYVGKCEKFLYEFQKDIPKLNNEYIIDYIKRKNAKIKGIYGIMYLVENYCDDNLGDRYN